MQSFQYKVLSLAVLTVLSGAAFANENQPVRQLETIEVTALSEGAKSKTNVVTTEIANKSTENDLRGLLSEEPAINFGGGNSTSQWVSIRGMGQDQIDVKVDNAYSDTQTFHHQGRFQLDPSLVKIVSVQKGAGSASAGIGATGGSISAKTLDALELLQDGKDFGIKVNGGYSSNDGHSKGISAFGRTGIVDLLVTGNWNNESNYKTGDGKRVHNGALDQRGLLAKLGVTPNQNHRVVASFRQELDTGVRNIREEFDGENAAVSYRETSTETVNLEWNAKDLGFIQRADANAYMMTNERFTPADNHRVEIETQGANLNLDSQLHQNVLLKYGFNYRHQKGNPPSLAAGTVAQEKTDTGLYAEAISHLGKFTLTTGVRYDHFDYTAMTGKKSSKASINPSVGVLFDINDHLSVNASLNYATRSPRLREVMLAGNSGRGAYQLVDGIKPEQAQNIEVGFNYDNGTFAAHGSYFWNTIEDYHASLPCSQAMVTPAQGGRPYCPVALEIGNTGKLKNTGYELGAAYKVNGLTARLGVAYSEPKLNNNYIDSRASATPQGRTWTTGLSYKFNTVNLELGWKGRLVEKKSYVNTQNTETVRKGFNVHDFYANWKPLANERLNVNVSINNAFDKFYYPHGQLAGRGLAGVGRDFRVGFNYTF